MASSSDFSQKSGSLYVVATPIGNLDDITFRAVKVLQSVDVIACEDTRHSGILLAHLGIDKPLVSYHEHNEQSRTADLLRRLSEGADVALISDAGTPLISDPGYRLARAAVQAGVRVISVPGASAILTALAASGLPTDAFYFGGFLPQKSSQRRKRFESLSSYDCTIIFFDAPHRIVETLADIDELMPNRTVVIGRELTKVHEELLRGSAAELQAVLSSRPSVKGEFTVLLGKPEEMARENRPAEEILVELLASGVARMDAIKQIARRKGVPKRQIYDELERSD